MKDQSINSAALINVTVNALKAAKGNRDALASAITQFLNDARAAHLEIEEIENILGVNEPSIMDLAELSEDDEEIVIDAFEEISANQ
ncbi:hypothetical protein GCM10011613_16430 [Cellvibrio zantedeschiae]|uniref:Uncharacterized protein n=1 Tax=Cellvibrio zantedeschiae TaxID=1237077 RepID=A0ABQ3B172_9GAMM|nr:hypothetical protein [Cellvibrio zantedeschiae]GGY72189.1 hypothetical protein GCM10011613_16430 [Cellvibrio zantedeschiae]